MTSDFAKPYGDAQRELGEVQARLEALQRQRRAVLGTVALFALPLAVALYIFIFLTICDYAALAWRSLYANVAG